jgi:V8-like Glu-specific endopeptidase
MITNNHVIDSNYINDNKFIIITLNNDKDDKIIKLNDKRIMYTNKEYDVAIIEIKPKDVNNYMELEDKLFKEESYLYYNQESIYNIHYSKEKVAVSYCLINKINKSNIIHFCRIDQGSSGSPILNISNNKIIGIHRENTNKFHQNYGIFLKEPINEFINKYFTFKNNYFKDSNIIKKEEEINFIISALKRKINFFTY